MSRRREMQHLNLWSSRLEWWVLIWTGIGFAIQMYLFAADQPPSGLVVLTWPLGTILSTILARMRRKAYERLANAFDSLLDARLRAMDLEASNRSLGG